jgi:putative DNA primase/helicase
MSYAGAITADGGIHRFNCEGERGRASWYILHDGPPVAGAFGCWRRGLKQPWCEERTGNRFSQAEWNAIRARWREAEAVKDRAEAGLREMAKRTAAWIMERSTPATGAHPYLLRKRVQAHGELREYRGALVLPLRNPDGELCSLQLIHPDGTKRFLTGGRVAGCYFQLAAGHDGPILLAEGYATGASLHEATGHAVVCVMNCGNLVAVAKALRARWPDREFVIAADGDQWTDGNPGATKGREAALAVGARLAVATFATPKKGLTDYNDLCTAEGAETVRNQIEGAVMPQESEEESLARLASLPLREYDKVRKAEARRLGLTRVATLDAEVEALRPQADNAVPDGADLLPTEPEPWPDDVSGGDLLAEIASTLNRFAVFPPHAADALALFILETYASDCFDAAPYVFLSSPEKRCGKSLVKRLLSKLCARPLSAGSCTESSIFRSIAAVNPTLLIDEVDTFFKERPELRGILNIGNVRDEAFVIRTEEVVRDGQRQFVPRKYPVFGPKVFAGIGRLADTLDDRCIRIPMRRKRPDEKRERFRRRKFDPQPVCRKCRRWATDNKTVLAAAEPSLPDELNDRAADFWEPLLAVADAAGGSWPERARAAAVALSGDEEASSVASVGTQLLADIKALFAEAGTDRLSSVDMCEGLVKLEERPWCEFDHGRPLKPNRLARMLAPYNVGSRKIRLEHATRQGYMVDDFADAWARYAASSRPHAVVKQNNGTRTDNTVDSSLSQAEHGRLCSTCMTTVSPSVDKACSVVPPSVPHETEGALDGEPQPLLL